MDTNEIKLILKEDDFVIIKRKKSWFIKFNDQLPSELSDKISSDDFKKLVNRYNKGFKVNGLSIIFACTIVLLPVSLYLIYKRIKIFTLLWYKEQADYRHSKCSFELLNASKKRATLVFKFSKNNITNNNNK